MGFPDDDCWYSRDLLINVIRSLELGHCDGVTGRVICQDAQVSAYLRFDETAGLVSLTNVWRRICSVTIFLKRKVVETIGGFDEMMGLGAGIPWEGGEDIDYPVRAMKAGGNGKTVLHLWCGNRQSLEKTPFPTVDYCILFDPATRKSPRKPYNRRTGKSLLSLESLVWQV